MNKENLANAFIDGSLSSGATSVDLKAGYVTYQPTTPYFATITPFGELSTKANSEIVEVTNISSNTLTIVRGQRGTTAKSFSDGAIFSNGIYVEDLNSIIDIVYPIGAIYMSVNSVNPSTLFGGTWVSWGSGRVPVGVDTGQTEFNTVGKTGGAKTHTLSVAELPNVSGYFSIHGQENGTEFAGIFGYATGSYVGTYTNTTPRGSGAGSYVNPGFNFGQNQAHNNLQPYITCYMWKRTA